MTAIDTPDIPVRSVSDTRTSSAWFLAAGGLLIGSFVLQLMASVERWGVLAASWNRAGVSIEDHLFDYWYPADPWQNLGSTAQVFGAGFLLLALGVLAAARAVPSRNSVFERVLVIVVAVAFAAGGAHALLSGLLGAPTLMQFPPLLSVIGLAGFGGLLVLAFRWFPASRPAALACLVLLGSTMPGYLFAAFQIAPIIAGYQSHDTTPWTEAVGAVATGAAGLVLISAAAMSAAGRRRASSSVPA